VVLPVLLIFALPVVLVIWLIRRARRNRKAAKPAA
jgi:cytochrome c oxidase assembly factor CtaG